MTKSNIIKRFDAKRLIENLKAMRGRTSAEVAAVIKADCYGTGMENTLPLLKKCGVKKFFAQSLAGAKAALKLLGPGFDIFVFDGVQKGDETEFLKYGFIPCIISAEQLTNFDRAAAKAKKKPKIALHFDTGMNRTGIKKGESFALPRNLEIILYMTHFTHMTNVQNQIRRFGEAIADLPKAKTSLIASSGAILPRALHGDIARFGFGLYWGVVSVWARILKTTKVKKGEGIGYFGNYVARRDMNIVTVAIGYKDGYPRSLSHTNTLLSRIGKLIRLGPGFARSYVVIGGIKCPVVGIVSMDVLMADASAVPESVLAKAEYAEVMGDDAELGDFRSANGYIPREMMVDLNRPNIDVSGWESA